MNRLILLFFLGFVSVILFGCGLLETLSGCTKFDTPKTYIQAVPDWKVIDIRDGLGYEESWQLTIDWIRKYDIESMDKRSGYLQTKWVNAPIDSPRGDYKTRITIKFSVPDKRQLELRVDATWHKVEWGCLTGGIEYVYGWVDGTDIQLADDLYRDLSVLLGRLKR